MKKLLTITFLFFALTSTFAQKVDTIYYDSNWKGVPIKSFASYMTVVYMSDNPQYPNLYKSFYITGEVQSVFTPVSVDKFDAEKSKFVGNYTTYYKSGNKRSDGVYNNASQEHGRHIEYYENGNIKAVGNYINGQPDGEMIFNFENGKVQGKIQYVNGLLNGEKQFYFENGKLSAVETYKDNLPKSTITYYENGNLKAKASFLNEKINGTMYQYFEDGSGCVETEMLDGNPKYDYVIYVDKEGNRTKYDKNLENIITEEPTTNDRKSTISNGRDFYYYQMNGIFIAVDVNAVDEMGKFWEASIVVGNNTNKPFIFDTSNMICYLEKEDKVESLKVYTSNEFSALVGKKIRRKSFWNAVGENLATMNAGTTTNNTSGYVNSAGVAVDNQGYVAAGVSSTYGSINSTTHNGAAQYQANQMASQNINQYNNQLSQYKQALDEGYLQSNNLNSGESITGNVCIKYQYKKGSTLVLKIPVNGISYYFSWNLAK